MVDITDLAAADSFLQNTPNCIVHRIELFGGQSSGLMKRVSQLSVAQPSTGRVGWGTVLLEGEEIKWLEVSVTEIFDNSLKELKIS